MLKKAKRNLLNALEKNCVKRTIVDDFKIDGIRYRVVDYTSWIPFYKNRRELIFKIENDNRKYIHSSIFLNPKYHFQPVYRLPQNIVSFWGKNFSTKNALVLGSAGCTFPRFYALHYPESKIIGVELSEQLVNIAKKHFLIDQISNQFDLYCDDAFRFVEEHQFEEKQNVIFVDIFDFNKLPSDVYSEEFLKSLFNCTDKTSIIMFNFLTEEPSKIIRFAENIKEPFDKKYVVCASNRCFLALVRAEESSKLVSFEECLKENMEVHMW